MLMVRRNNYSNWLDNFFDDSLSDTELMPQRNTTAPALNVKETAEDYIMEMAVPGLEKEWVRINVTNEGLLHVAIENKMEHKEEDKKQHYLRREFSYSNYQQTYVLPDDIVKDNISAKVDNGVLTVTMPKVTKEEVKKIQRQIEIA